MGLKSWNSLLSVSKKVAEGDFIADNLRRSLGVGTCLAGWKHSLQWDMEAETRTPKLDMATVISQLQPLSISTEREDSGFIPTRSKSLDLSLLVNQARRRIMPQSQKKWLAQKSQPARKFLVEAYLRCSAL